MGKADAELYVYALAERGLPRRIRIARRSLRIRTMSGIDVVADSDCGPGEANIETLRTQHAILVSLMKRAGALLPVRFGTRLREPALRAVIADHAATIGQAFDLVRGRSQMTLRVFGEGDATRPREDRAGGGAAYLRSRRDRVRHLPPEIDAIRSALGSHVTAERAEAGDPPVRLTVFHLVPAGSIGRYRRAASALHSVLQPHRLAVSGPWPPFAFSPDLL